MSSVREAATATGKCTRTWPRASASPRVQPGAALHRRQHRSDRQHHRQAGGQPQRLRHRLAGARRHGPERGLSAARGRRRAEVPAASSCRRSSTRGGSMSFVADGELPVEKIEDTGFYVQAAFFPVPKKLELYVATSQIFGDDDAGFDDSSEYLVGHELLSLRHPQHRLNLQYIDVNHSPVGSTFGYYTADRMARRCRSRTRCCSMRSCMEVRMKCVEPIPLRQQAGAAMLLAARVALLVRSLSRRLPSRSRRTSSRLPLPPHQLRPGGTDIREFLAIMGDKVGRWRCSGSRCSSSGRTGTAETARPPTIWIPTRRSTTTRLPTPTSRRHTGRCRRNSRRVRSHDHRLQPDRHVRGRPHPARAADVSGSVLWNRRVHDSQGVRFFEGGGRGGEPEGSGARPDSRLRGRGGAGRHPA